MSQSEPSLVTHFDSGGLDKAVAEADVEGAVGADVVDGTDRVSVRCGDKAVSSGESGHGREVGKGAGDEFHAVAGVCESPVHEGVELFAAVCAAAGKFDLQAHEAVYVLPCAVEGDSLVADSGVGGEVVDLPAQAQEVCAAALDLLVHRVVKSTEVSLEVCVVLAQVKNSELRGCRGCGGSEVSDKVCDDCVGLVSHGGDDRRRAVKNSFGDAFFVECPEVFEGSSSPSDDDDVDACLVQCADAVDYTVGGSVALYERGIQDDLDIGIASF